ncbi:MAG: fibronectin type III domain-containing protein [Prevotella sp.]|nr:fibronectin type III domain-containing protein [Prevotella sp.]
MKIFVYMALFALSVCGCGGGDDEPGGNGGENNGNGSNGNEQVFTGMATNVTATAATITCNFASNSNASSLQLGVLYSTERSVIDNKQGVLILSSNVSGNTYTLELSSLTPNIIYYYRAFMISGGTTYYGSVNSFTTSQEEKVSTGEVTDMTYKSATISSSFLNKYISSYDALGVQYSDNKEIVESGKGSAVTTSIVTSGNVFTITLTNLTEQTTYYYRAFVKDYKTTYLGETKSFTTPKNPVDYNGHAWVDLGLPSGTKWATMNVGASKPEEYGDYYAWGETTTKTSYTLDNYYWKGLTKEDLVARGVVNKNSGNDYILTASYDVATVKWGSTWRMPTGSEISELEKNVDVTSSKQNGVNGFLLTSRINGKSIFLPASGSWDENGFKNNYTYRGQTIYILYNWGAELNQYYEERGMSINISDDDLKYIYYPHVDRYKGLAVRPVTSY